MKYKKTAETLEKGSHTLERNYYINPEILSKEYENIFLKKWSVLVDPKSYLNKVITK